jgi:Fur family transcriptional regulator, ferric uptake regulator
MQRQTKQRQAIRAALAQDTNFRSAAELHETLGDDAPSLATVYRTLQTLADGGEAETLIRGAETVYRICPPEHHHHLLCTQCNSATDIAATDIEDWAARTAAEHGYRLTHHTIELRGVCARCQA